MIRTFFYSLRAVYNQLLGGDSHFSNNLEPLKLKQWLG